MLFVKNFKQKNYINILYIPHFKKHKNPKNGLVAP